MAHNTDYGRPSTDDHDEGRPLLDDEFRDPEHTRPSDRQSFVQRLKRHLSATFAPLAKPQDLRPLERFLIALAVVLLLLAAIFIGLFAGAQHRLSRHPNAPSPWPAPGNPHQDPPPEAEVCTSKECVIVSSELIRGIDTSVDPCDDFYSFAAGGWLKNHPIPGDAGLFGTGQFVAQQNAKIIKQILADAPTLDQLDRSSSDQDRADGENLAKLKAYYTSCIDTKAQDKAGPEPLLEVTHELKQRLNAPVPTSHQEQEQELVFRAQLSDSGKPLPPNQPPGRSPKPHPPKEDPKPAPPSGKRQRGLTQALAWAHSRGLSAFFEIFMDGDPVNDPKAATPYLMPSGLGLPDRAYYEDKDELDFYRSVVEQGLRALDKEEHKKAKAAYQKSKKGNKATDKPKSPASPDLKQLAAQVVEFERLIADITPDIEDLTDPVGSYNPVNASSLPYLFQSIDWPSYLSALTVRTPKQIIVVSPKFLTSLDSLLSRTRTNVLEAYLAWTAVRELGTALGPNVALRAPAERLDRYTKGVEADAKEDRESLCLMDINQQLGFMAGRYFVREAFKGESKSRVETIIKSVIRAFKSRLPELDWLDEKTRVKAEEKADAIRVMVGYPSSPNTTDAVSVQRYYADLEVKPGDYFGNRLGSAVRVARRDWAQAGRQLDPERWDMFPAEVNAEYSPQGNYILFPAGIMQPPYFDVSWPSYLQYGAFGAVAGHELSHAFDPDGRLYDGEGYMRDWWTEETAREFEARQTCLADQYARYTIPDGRGGSLHLKPNFTKGEDVADAGGLAQSYRAWRDELASASASGSGSGSGSASEANALLPGLGYTREQLFFIAYGLSWARNIRDSELVRRLRTDPHSPTKYRVNGVVVNSPEFAHAFACTPGKDRMAKARDDICSIW